MACGGAVEKLLLQRLLGDGQVRLVVEGGMDADLHRPAGEEQQHELLASEGVEPSQAGPFTLLALVLGGVERVKDVLQIRRGALASRWVRTINWPPWSSTASMALMKRLSC